MCLVVGLVLRLSVMGGTPWPPGDALHYLNQAKFAGSGAVWSPIDGTWLMPPLFSVGVYVASGFSSDPFQLIQGAVVFNIVCGLALIVAVWSLARVLVGEQGARWAALLASADPLLVHYSVTMLSEPLYLVMLVGAVASGVRGGRGSVWWGLGAYLTRALGIVVFPAVALGVWLGRRPSRTAPSASVSSPPNPLSGPRGLGAERGSPEPPPPAPLRFGGCAAAFSQRGEAEVTPVLAPSSSSGQADSALPHPPTPSPVLADSERRGGARGIPLSTRGMGVAWALFVIGVVLNVGWVARETGTIALDGKSAHQWVRLTAPDLEAESRDPNYEGLVDSETLLYAPETPWFEPLEGAALVTGNVKKYLLRERRVWLQYLTEPVPPTSIPLFAGPLLVLVGAGLMLWARALPRGWEVWGCVMGAILFIQPLTFIEPRYFIGLLPLCLPMAGLALATLSGWLTERGKRVLEPSLMQGAVAGAVVLAGVAGSWATIDAARGAEQRDPYREAAVVVREDLPEYVGVEARKLIETGGQTAYYLGIPAMVVPDVGPEELRRFAEIHGADALVLDEYVARRKHNRVLLQFLYDSPQDYPEYGVWLLGMGEGWVVYSFGPLGM